MSKRSSGPADESDESGDEKPNDAVTTTRRGALALAGLTGLGLVSRPAAARGGNQPFYDWREDVDANGRTLTNLGALSTVDNPAAIRNLAGQNLSVEDGVLHADVTSDVWTDQTGDGLLETPSHDGISVPGVVTEYVETTTSEFTVGVLPDTQNYSQLDNGVFERQTEWLAENAAELDLELVLHLGDLVSGPDVDAEWDVAEDAIGTLDDAGIPTLLCFGNHDAVDLRDPWRFRERFPIERYERVVSESDTLRDWGSYEGYPENVYLTQRVLGERFLYLTLEFGPRDEVLAWANDVLADHPDHSAVVVTHSFTAPDGTLVDAGTRYAPSNYFDSGADVNDGVDVWDKFLSNHRNVQYVQSAHHLATNYADSVASGDENNLVTRIFSNYQTEPNGGDGWLRLNRVDVDREVVDVDTYSPYRDEWADSGGETFDFDLWEYETRTVARGRDAEERLAKLEGEIRSIVRRELVDVVSPEYFLNVSFDAGSGDVVTDRSQFDFDGRLDGTYEWVADGIVGFDADAGGYVDLGSPRLLTGLEGVTYEAVVRPTGYPDAYGIVASKHNGGDDGEWYLALSEDTFRFAHVSESDGRRYLDHPHAFDVGELYHLAVAHDAADGTFTFYVNGEEIASESRSGTTKGTSNPLYLGNYAPVGDAWQYGGEIHSFAIHPEPLQADELSARFEDSVANVSTSESEATETATPETTGTEAPTDAVPSTTEDVTPDGTPTPSTE